MQNEAMYMWCMHAPVAPCCTCHSVYAVAGTFSSILCTDTSLEAGTNPLRAHVPMPDLTKHPVAHRCSKCRFKQHIKAIITEVQQPM